MQSLDGSINIKSIYYPFYYATFNNVPHNPFSTMLFSYLGEISPVLYKNNLDKFKDYLDKIDLTEDNDSFRETIIDKYNVNSDTWVKILMEDIQAYNSSKLYVYTLLSFYFNLSYNIFLSKEELFNDRNDKYIIYNNKYNSREVYFILNKEKIPFNILKQDTNGNIRIYSRIL